MKRKYILFGPAYGIGGWQLYINARCKYLLEKNVDLYLIFPPNTGGNEIKLEYILKAKKYPIELVEPYWYSRSYVEKKIHDILRFVNFNSQDDIFIESTCIIYSFWGEILAESTNGQNFCYLLHSHTKGFPLAWKKFFSYKYDQGLIAGQSEITIPDLLLGYRSISKEDSRPIFAQWEGPICNFREDCKDYILHLRKYKDEGYKLIGYFGVLRKPHFLLMCDFIVKYSNKYPECKFMFIAIGSSGGKSPELKLYDIPQYANNCKVYNIPEMYPIPKEIFELLDVCVASCGSAVHAATVCKRTIRLYDDVKIVPSGIIGINLKEPYHLKPPAKESIEEFFDKILFGDNYKSIPYCYPREITTSYGGHEMIDLKMKPFIRRKSSGYYNVLSMPFDGEISKIKYIIFHVFGVKFTRKMIAYIRGIFGNRT